MNKSIPLVLAALAAAGCTSERPAELAARTDAALTEELRGRTIAGPAVDCVESRDLRGHRSAGEGAIIFNGPSGLIYVNRPGAGGCPVIRLGRTLVNQNSSSRLCRGDIVGVVDPVSGFEYGGCALGSFTPYRRVDRGG